MAQMKQEKQPHQLRIFLGITALVFYMIHAGFLLMTGESPGHLLWACHLGAAAVGLGLLTRRAVLYSTGILWLGLGNIMWILYLLGKGEFSLTSVLTHVGGFVIGLFAIYKLRLGWARFSWLWAIVGIAALQQLCRWVTPEKENINLAFRIHEGWEKLFPSYGWYLVVLFITCGVVFYLLGLILKKAAARNRK